MNTKVVLSLSILIGAFIFILMYGVTIINPTNIGWVMAGDPGAHFLGWHFFRSEPWHFPLGIIEKYHYPSGTGMVYMDSIPLIGIPLKLFDKFLPQPFQYIGLWLMVTYMLQGFFASLLLKKFTNDWRLILVGTTFFILSPIIFWRAGCHESLAGHWLILASLYLYLSKTTISTRKKWILLILISSMVHFYLLVMVLTIWGGYVLKELLSGFNKKHIAIHMLLTISVLLVNMWIIGYFSISVSDAGTGGFGYHSMNILSPFNPMGAVMSSPPVVDANLTFFKNINMATKGQYEGFNYLGFGLLLLILLSFIKLPKVIKNINLKLFLPLFIISLLLFIFSLSDKITLGDNILLEFKYPWVFEDLSAILRASGRMFWVVYYLIMLSTIVIVIKYFKPKIALIFLSLALLIQVIDFYPWYSNRNLNNRTFETSLKSGKWNTIAGLVKHIVMIPPSNQSKSKNNFALYASNNHLDINIGYVAREDTQKRFEYNQKIMKEFEDNKLKKDTLYIVSKHNLILPSEENREKYLFGTFDNYHIIIPKTSRVKLGSWFDWSNILSKKIYFNSGEVIFYNWSHIEKIHRWSLGNTSSIYFKLKEKKPYKGKLYIDFGTLGKQRILIYLNDQKISDKTFNSWDISRNFEFNPDILKSNEINTIRFEFPNAHKPNNIDKRVLAMALKFFKID